MADETDRERIVKLEVTLTHVVANQVKLEEKMDKNHDEILQAIKERQCPSPMCKEHTDAIIALKEEQGKIKQLFFIAGTLLSMIVSAFVYWLFNKYG